MRAGIGRGAEDQTECEQEQIAKITGQMHRALNLDLKRQWRAPEFRQHLFHRLRRTFRPAVLLRLKRRHFDWQLGGRDNLRQEQKPPAFDLGPVTQVQVFGERIRLPAPGRFNARPAPDTAGPVEIEKSTGPGARSLLDQKMRIEQDGLDAREQGERLVQMAPAGLQHANPRIGKIMNRLL